jgi:TRAP-type transport system periplasmic protein
MSTARRGGLAVVVVAALTVLLILTAATASAQVKWKLPSAYPAANQNLEAFAKDVAQVTDGKLAISIYPNSSLFPASAIQSKSVIRYG